MNSYVEELAIYNGELIAGGWFATAGGVTSSRWARWGLSEIYSGDLNHDCVVNLLDFALFSESWQKNDCLYNSWCYETDMNYDFTADFKDLSALVDNWLFGQ